MALRPVGGVATGCLSDQTKNLQLAKKTRSLRIPPQFDSTNDAFSPPRGRGGASATKGPAAGIGTVRVWGLSFASRSAYLRGKNSSPGAQVRKTGGWELLSFNGKSTRRNSSLIS